MNILVFNDNLEGGGAEQYLQAMVDELENRGHNLLRIVFSKKKFTDSGIVSLDYNTGLVQRAFRRYTFDISAYRRIRSAINSFEPDIVHIHNNFNSPLTILLGLRDLPVIKTVHDAGFVLSNVLEIPHLVSIHGGDIYDPTKTLSPHNSDVMQKVVSRLLKSADQVVAQSSDIKSRAYDYYSLPNVDIETIPLPYESVSFDKLGVDELGLDENKTYIVSIGRLVKRKGYKYLIESIATLPTEIELLLIGDGPEEERLRRLADDLGVLSRIEFLGHVSEKNKFNYLDKSSVFVMSSLHEGFGIVLQEAMQVGLPIVTTDTGGQTDLVEDDVHGRIVSAKDPNALSRAILEVLEDNTTDYETNAYQKLEEYDLDRICKMYVNQFNKITK